MQCTPKMPSPCLHLYAMFAPMCHAFKMQPKLHNSVGQGISKCVYLCLHPVVCFYPWPPFLTLVVRLYLPLFTINICSMLSLRLLSGHFEGCSLNSHSENILPFFIVGSEQRQNVCQTLPYFPWEFNKIVTLFSKLLMGIIRSEWWK